MGPLAPVQTLEVAAQQRPAQPQAASAGLRASFAQALERAAGSTEVSPVKTPLSEADAAGALERAWTRRHGAPPSRETLSLLTAQWSHETGRGRSMYNYNFAGIKGASPAGHTTMLRTREGSGATERHITDGFRAYASADDGADDYLGLLERRYGGALDAAKQGDAAGFVHSLKQKGYFTGDELAYARSVSKLAGRVLNEGPSSNVPESASAGGLPLDTLAPTGNTARAAGRGQLEGQWLPEQWQLAQRQQWQAGSAGVDAPPAAGAASLATFTALDAQLLADELSRSALRIQVANRDRG